MFRRLSSLCSAAILAALVLLGCQSPTTSTPSTPVPNAPQGLVVEASSGAVTVKWTPAQGVQTYRLYWGVSGTAVGPGKSSPLELPAVGSIGTGIDSLQNGTTYDFVLTAVNAGGESAASAKVSATPGSAVSAPDAPVGLTVTPANGAVSVSWTAAQGVQTYHLYWGVSGTAVGPGKSLPLELPAAGSIGTGIDSLKNGTTYDFVLTAVNAGGESAASAKVSATPLGCIAGYVNVSMDNLAGTWTTTESGIYGTPDKPSGTTSTEVTLDVLSNGGISRREVVHTTLNNGSSAADSYREDKGTASLVDDALTLSFTQHREGSSSFSDDAGWTNSTMAQTSTVAISGGKLYTRLHTAQGSVDGLVGTWVQDIMATNANPQYNRRVFTFTATTLTVDQYGADSWSFSSTPGSSQNYNYGFTDGTPGTFTLSVGGGQNVSVAVLLLGNRYLALDAEVYTKK